MDKVGDVLEAGDGQTEERQTQKECRKKKEDEQKDGRNKTKQALSGE